MEVKRTWKRIIAAFLTFVMAFCFIPNIPALAADIDPATDEWQSYKRECTPITGDNDASRIYGDTGTYSTHYYYDDNESGDFELYFRINGSDYGRNNSKNNVSVQHNNITFEAHASGNDIYINITNAWNGAAGTYEWSLYEQDDDNNTSSDDPITGGTFTISPRPVTLHVWPIDMYYGENNKVIQYKYTVEGVVPGDSAESVIANVYSSAEGTVPDANHTVEMTKHTVGKIDRYVAGINKGNYSISGVSTSDNYSIANAADFNIRQVDLSKITVSFNDKISKVYDGNDFEVAPTFSYYNKPITLTEETDYNFTWKKAGTSETFNAPNTAGEYTAIITACDSQTNTTNNNTGFNFTVEKKPITIVTKDQGYVFDGTPKAKTAPGDYDIAVLCGRDKNGDDIAIDLAETDVMSGYTLVVGDGSEDDLKFSTYVADTEDADGDGDTTEKIRGSKDITLLEDSIVINRNAASESGDLPAGTNVTDSYDITIVSEGKLTIAPKENAGSVAAVDTDSEYFAKINDAEYDYDGSKKSLDDVEYTNIDNVIFAARDLTVEYSVDGGKTWTTKKPSFTDAGVYEIQYRIAHGADYNNGYPNADVHCYDLLFSEIKGEATLTINGTAQTDASVAVLNVSEESETPGWTYGDDITGKITVKDATDEDITNKTDFTGGEAITYRYIAGEQPNSDEHPDENNNAWKAVADDVNDSGECVIPAGNYWLEATIPAYGSYAETKVYTQFTVEKKAIKVGLNRFEETVADGFTAEDYNNTEYVKNSEKYTYDGVVGNEDPLDVAVNPDDPTGGKYSNVKIIKNSDNKDALAFSNEFDGDEDIFDNYVITVVDQIGEGEDAIITDGLITLVPVDIDDTLKSNNNKFTGTVGRNFVEYNGPWQLGEDDSIYFQWTGEPAGPEINSLYLKKTKVTEPPLEDNDKIALTADDYTAQYFKLDDDGLISVQPLEGLPTDAGDYVLVLSGKNVKPGSTDEPVNAEAKVYGTTEIKFSITDRIFVLDVRPKDREYKFNNTSVEMDLEHATLYSYNNQTGDYDTVVDGELKAAILADDNVKNITGEMEDDSVGDNKPVTVNDGKSDVSLATDGYENCKVILQCSEDINNAEDYDPCAATVTITKASLDGATLTIGGKNPQSWQYGDFENAMAEAVLTPAVQSAEIDGETVVDPTFDNTVTYYYVATSLEFDSGTQALTYNNSCRTIEELQAWIKSNKDNVGKYWIKAVISDGTNYNGTTVYATVTVNKRNITITANEQYRYYMDDYVADTVATMGTNNYTVTHVKDDGTVVENKDANKLLYKANEGLNAVISGNPSCADVTSERTLDVGDYVISQGDPENGGLKVAEDYSNNYELVFEEGIFRILPLPLDNEYDDENYPKREASEDFEVKVRLEKSEYVYDGTEKNPQFTVVYTDGNESYTIPQEQYQYYYTLADKDSQTTVKNPAEYNVYVYKANGKNNLKDGHITRGEFEITKIPVTVKITMTQDSTHPVFDGATTTISDVTYTTELLYRPSEDGGYEEIPDLDSLSTLKNKFANGQDEDYIAQLYAMVLPSTNAGIYALGTGENNINVSDLNDYLASQIDDDTHEYCLDDVIYEGRYVVEKAPLNDAQVSMVESVEYTGDYQRPEVTVTLTRDGKDIPITDKDLVITYGNNKKVSTTDSSAVVTIKPSNTGNFVLVEEPSITKNFEITPKVITVKSNLALEDKTYDGNAQMKVVGDYEATDFIEDEEAELVFTYGDDTDITNLNLDGEDVIEVSQGPSAGEKEEVINVEIQGEDATNYKLEVEYADDDNDDNGLLMRPLLPNDEITVKGTILPKEVKVVSTLALTDKTYDGSKAMKVTGEVTTTDFIDGDDVEITGADDRTVNVANASAGDKTYTFNLSLTGDDKANYKLTNNAITAKGKINKKDVTATSTLALVDKAYDGNTKMSVTGSVKLSGVIGQDDVKVAESDVKTVNVASPEAGDKTYTFKFTLSGSAKDNYNLKTTSATAKGKIISTGTLTEKGIYCMQVSPNIVAGMVVEKSDAKDVVEYRWEAIDADHPEKGWFEVSSWKKDNEWLDWTPSKAGNYVIVGHARIVGNPKTEVTSSFGTPYKVIKGTAQMPNSDGGYLIGLETYNNPNQSYRYEILILDCTLYAQGLPAWTYTTNPQTVASGNAFWTVWQPEYGYYWTLFRVYDAQGNLVDEEVFGFANTQ